MCTCVQHQNPLPCSTHCRVLSPGAPPVEFHSIATMRYLATPQHAVPPALGLHQGEDTPLNLGVPPQGRSHDVLLRQIILQHLILSCHGHLAHHNCALIHRDVCRGFIHAWLLHTHRRNAALGGQGRPSTVAIQQSKYLQTKLQFQQRSLA